MDTQTQIDRLIELAIIQRSELKQLVEQLPQLREHLNAEVEKVFDETEPQLRAELEEFIEKRATDATAKTGAALEAKIKELSSNLEISTQARFNAIIAEREENARLAAQAEAKIAEHAASLPSAVKDIVTAELARFPRAGEIDQLRKEFAEPRGLNPRGKWQAGETYNKLDLVTINGDSYTSNTDGNRTRPSRSSADWTLVAARGTGGGGGPTSLSELTTVPSDGDLLIGSGTSWVTSNLTAGAGISITVGPGAITISATDGDITLDDGTAASPSLHFTNDPDTGIYRPAANTLGISTSGVQRMYVDQNGITTVGAGGTFDGSVHAANGNANNPSFSFSSDQDTGFFRHQPNEIGVSLGGTQYATLTSTTFSITPVVTMASSLRVNGTTDSSSKDTGAIVTEGGLGVEKSATIGGNLTVSGTATIGNQVTTNGASAGYRFDPRDGSGANWLWYNPTGDDARLYNTSGAGDVLTITNAGAATLSGNLTVSGTGNSSIAGNLLFNTSTARGILTINKTASDTLSTANAAAFIGQPDNLEAGLLMQQTASTPYSFVLQGRSPSGTYQFPISLNPQGGNVLIGTTVDSSALLQVGTNTTTAAGGMKFGTDTALYRAAAQSLNLDGASSPQFSLSVSGTQKARFESYSDDLYISTLTAGKSIILRSGNGTTALTLDSSQNATFAGNVVLGAGKRVAYSASAYMTPENNVDGAEIASPGQFTVKTASTQALKIDSSQNATFAGDVGLSGNEKYLNLFSTYIVGSNSRARLRAVGSGGGSGYGGSFTVDTRTSGNTFITALTIDDAQNATFAGNLTVSGTAIGLGGSTVPAWSSHNVLQTSDLASFGSFTGNKNAQVMHNAFWNGSAYKYIETAASSYYAQTAGVHSWFTAASGTAGNTITFAEAARITSGGNVLIGTTTDSANGKLQLATHTTSAGGIGFGTDTSWYRSQGGVLTLDTSANFQGFEAKKNGTLNFNFYSNSSDTFIGYKGTGSLTIQTLTGSPALTLDSSQNATFAGQITASGISHKLGSGGTGAANALLTLDGSSASSYGSYIVLQRNSTNKWQFGTYSGINGGTSDDFLLYNPTAANEALKIAAATSNATFAGSIAIGNTVNTVSPTSPNRTITMVIGGTTYYIHAKTTND